MLCHMIFSEMVDVPKSNTTIISTIIEWYVDLKIGTKKKCVKKIGLRSQDMLVILGSIVNMVELYDRLMSCESSL